MWRAHRRQSWAKKHRTRARKWLRLKSHHAAAKAFNQQQTQLCRHLSDSPTTDAQEGGWWHEETPFSNANRQRFSKPPAHFIWILGCF